MNFEPFTNHSNLVVGVFLGEGLVLGCFLFFVWGGGGGKI